MLISRKSALKSLEEEPKKKFNIHVSKSDLSGFASACKLDGQKNFSPVLENLLAQFIDKVGKGKVDDLPIPKRDDRKTSSFTCKPDLYESFDKAAKKINSKSAHVIEFLMCDYKGQAEKEHGIKIEP